MFMKGEVRDLTREEQRDRRIKTMNQVRTALNEVVNTLRRIEPKTAKDAIELGRVQAYTLSIMMQVVKESEMETELERLKVQLNEIYERHGYADGVL